MNDKLSPPLHIKLNQLAENNQLPLQRLRQGGLCYRVQKTHNTCGGLYTEAYFFAAPTTDLGRYNDPECQLKICYVASNPAISLAEVFSRDRQRDLTQPSSFFIGSRELQAYSMAISSLSYELNLLNLGALLPHLGKAADEFSGNDYHLNQELVRFFSLHPRSEIDGIAYRSRHLDDGGYCYALWCQNNQPMPLITRAITTLQTFECPFNQPSIWAEETIDSEEILTELLGFSIIDDDDET